MMDSSPGVHPYYPPESLILGGYAPNELGLPALLSRFVGTIAIHLGTTWILARLANKNLGVGDQLAFLWFMLCGFLHCFFEGYFITHHSNIASSQDLFAQLWKEYSLSDSRYMTSDPFMLCIETLTVYIWGPLSILTAVLIVCDRKGLRHVIQIVVSVGHLYGVLLYYGTCYFEEHFRGVAYSRPEFLYYWVYYIGLNSPWAIVPSLLLFQSARAIHRSYRLSSLNSTPKEVKNR